MLRQGRLVADRKIPRYAPPAPVNLETLEAPPTGFKNYEPGTAKDLRLILPTGAARSRQTQTTNARSTTTIGGLMVPSTAESAVMRASNIVEFIFWEGIRVWGNNFDTDAFDGGGGRTPEYRPDVYLQKLLTQKLLGEFGSEFHSDAYQPQNPIGTLYIDLCTFKGGYQMIFIRPQYHIDEVFISRSNMEHDANFAEGLPLWLTNGSIGVPSEPSPHPIHLLDEVYVRPKTGHTLAESVFPVAGTVDENGVHFGAVEHEDAQGHKYIEFDDPNIDGKVLEGPPPLGDFCTVADCGLGYEPHGYAGV